MRVLVTGSQLWDDPDPVYSELSSVFQEATSRNEVLVVVHGACPNGADLYADLWATSAKAQGLAVEIDPHPAEWRKNGKLDKGAGFRRNAEMVKLGADICLAFILNNSNGATHTAKLAEKAGIKTIRHIRSTIPMSDLAVPHKPLPPYRYKRVQDELTLLGVKLQWRNFAGEERLFNEKGKRNFAIPMDMETALQLREIGWRVRDNEEKVLDGRAQELMFHLDVTVKMDGKVPPRIFMITKKWSEKKQEMIPMRTLLDEEIVGLLDYAEFDNVDLILRPYNWKMKGSGKEGVTAYLKTLYATLHQDPLDEMYAHIPLDTEIGEQLAIEPPDDFLEGEVVAEWDNVEIDDNGRLALERGSS